MAKIKKRKLGWAASTSPQVVGYKFYWAEGENVSYDSPSVILGNVTEIVLPDDVEGFNPQSGPVEFGITALDELGNESDLVTFSAAYQFNIPKAPEDLWLEAMEEFHAPESESEDKEASRPITLYEKVTPQQETPDEDSTTDEPEETPAPVRAIQHYGHQDGE